MYSESDIEAAVAAGAISAASADQFRAFVGGTRSTPAVDEEHFRLITGFNDIFVSIATVLLLVALGWIGSGLSEHFTGPSPISGVLIAAAAWGLAEFFTLRRRMALPSILLLLAFVGGVFEAIGAVLVPHNGNPGNVMIALTAAASGAVAAASAWLHWRRFQVPITIAAGAGALVVVVIGLLVAAFPQATEWVRPMMFFSGVAVFAFAMRWDMSDPARQTRRSDVAFWLHLLAAPLLVHPVFTQLGLLNGAGGNVTGAIIAVGLYVVLGFVALAIDRRALMVSALAYVLYALSALFREFGAVSLNVALTGLVIGSALLVLSAFWHSARAAVLRALPSNLQERLPKAGQTVAMRPAVSG